MEFKSQICTTAEQSRKLLELGLKPETADMHYQFLDNVCKEGLYFNQEAYSNVPNYYLPAWSLHRLLEILSEPYNSYELNIKGLTYDGIIKIIENNPKVMNLCNG